MLNVDLRILAVITFLTSTLMLAMPATAAVVGVHAGGDIDTPCSPLSAGGFRCGPGIVTLDEDYDFGLDDTSAAISVASGSANGQASISFGANGTPVFTVGAFSTLNNNVSVRTESMRQFIYTGPDAFLLTATGNFHVVLNGLGTAANAGIALIPEDPDLDFVLEDVFNTGKFGGGLSGFFNEGVFPLDSANGSQNLDGEFDINLSVSTTVNNGDVLWLWGRFGAYATNGGTANGLNTGTFVFNTDNIQAVAVIPVPAAVWLFASGLGLLGAMLRRRV